MKRILLAGSMGMLVLALTFATALADSNQSLPFRSSGSGTETSLSVTGCQFTAAGCTVQTNGTATSEHLGTGPYVSTLAVDWALATKNDAGGFCAPAKGPSTLTAANGSTLTLFDTGTVCEVGATGTNVPHTFTGTYSITGGTGHFSGATGSGTVSGGDDGSGNSSFTASGTIKY